MKVTSFFMLDIGICSHNSYSLYKSIDIIRKLIDMEFGIIFLQKIFITNDKLGELDFIIDHDDSVEVKAVFSEKSLLYQCQSVTQRCMSVCGG